MIMFIYMSSFQEISQLFCEGNNRSYDSRALLLWSSSGTQPLRLPYVQVGNAAYHDDRLYDQLQRCIPHLTILLEDEEDKTKSNAAGALSNLVRNSNRLCDDIISKGALQVPLTHFFAISLFWIS